MSCNVCLSGHSSFKCWLNCSIVLWKACRQFTWCSRDEGKRAENPGVGWWTAASGLDWFVGWRRGRRKVPSKRCWLIEGAREGMVCGGMPQSNWAKGRLIVLEWPNELGGSEEDWWWGRKTGARGLSDISREVRWLPLVVLLFFEREEMCFELYILCVCYPKKLFPLYGILAWESIVNVD